MLAIVLWLVYAIPGYILSTFVFRLRYGFSPVTEPFPPRNLYGWVDMVNCGVLCGYSAWLVLGPRVDPARALGVPLGVTLCGAGIALRWWSILTLGPHWRIGQDENDPRAACVTTGPYRLIRHPINAGYVLVAAGMLLITGPDARALMLLGASIAYYAVQGRAEEKRWQTR